MAPVPLCLPHITHEITRNSTWASATRTWRLAGMTWTSSGLSSVHKVILISTAANKKFSLPTCLSVCLSIYQHLSTNIYWLMGNLYLGCVPVNATRNKRSVIRTNAAVERVFSLMNTLWTDERNWLELCAVKLTVLMKHHFRNYTCTELHEFLLLHRKILEQMHCSAKCISAPSLPTQMEEVSWNAPTLQHVLLPFKRINQSAYPYIIYIAFPRYSDVLF